MARIVILGAGFAGLSAALEIEKKFKNRAGFAVTLVSQRDYFLFTPNLFEVAASLEEITTLSQLKKSIYLPIREVLKGKKIKFIQGEVLSVDLKNRQVSMPGRKLDYDYLLLALGSETEHYGIPGAKENSIGLKSLKEALLIRSQMEFLFQMHQHNFVKPGIRIVIAGGGYAGVELAGELAMSLSFLAWKYGYPKRSVELEIIDANSALLSNFDPRLSRGAERRLKSLGVRLRLASRIAGVTHNLIELASGERVHFDLLIWTAGIKAGSLPGLEGFERSERGHCLVNPFLQIVGQDNVFALGDLAYVGCPNGKAAFASAQDAWSHARYIAGALPMLMSNKKPPAFKPDYGHGFIVNAGGKWAVMVYKGIYLSGFFAYLVDKFAHVRFYASLVGLWKAFKYVFWQMELYSRND